MKNCKQAEAKKSLSFFVPDNDFVAWIGKHASGRMIVDVGCGEGELIQKLFISGCHSVLGIDAFKDYLTLITNFRAATGEFGASKFITQDISSPIFEKIFSELKPLVLLCRPCHHPMLIRTTLELCKSTGVELLYIGLERNIERDFGSTHAFQKLQHEGGSRDSEIVLKLL